MKRINCRGCQYYFVTWEPEQPHGCKAYGFRSQQVPSLLVFQSSNAKCALFKEKSQSK